ncbi:MAG: hypothetical protein GY801_01225 [bacterium]|nr:hypothetical protein [bacterium]
MYNYYQVYGLTEHAGNTSAEYGKQEWLPNVNADACTECDVCETRCPQHIQIRTQLQEAHQVLCG